MDSNGASCEGVPDLYKVLGVQRAATSVEVCGLVPSACVDNLHVQGIGRALQSAPAPATVHACVHKVAVSGSRQLTPYPPATLSAHGYHGCRCRTRSRLASLWPVCRRQLQPGDMPGPSVPAFLTPGRLDVRRDSATPLESRRTSNRLRPSKASMLGARMSLGCNWRRQTGRRENV